MNLFLARNDTHLAVVSSNNNNLRHSAHLTPHYTPALCMVMPPASGTASVNVSRYPASADGSIEQPGSRAPSPDPAPASSEDTFRVPAPATEIVCHRQQVGSSASSDKKTHSGKLVSITPDIVKEIGNTGTACEELPGDGADGADGDAKTEAAGVVENGQLPDMLDNGAEDGSGLCYAPPCGDLEKGGSSDQSGSPSPQPPESSTASTFTETQTQDKNPVTFSDLKLSSKIVQGLNEAFLEQPTSTQCESVAKILCGQDCVIVDKSGTGKTVGYMACALELVKPELHHPQVLVIVPTRQAAIKAAQVAKLIGPPDTSVAAFIAGCSVDGDLARAQVCQLAVGTPGRVKQLISEGLLSVDNVKLVVLDKAHNLLDYQVVQEVSYTLEKIPSICQLVSVSTQFPPKLATWVEKIMKPGMTFAIGEEVNKWVDDEMKCQAETVNREMMTRTMNMNSGEVSGDSFGPSVPSETVPDLNLDMNIRSPIQYIRWDILKTKFMSNDIEIYYYPEPRRGQHTVFITEAGVSPPPPYTYAISLRNLSSISNLPLIAAECLEEISLADRGRHCILECRSSDGVWVWVIAKITTTKPQLSSSTQTGTCTETKGSQVFIPGQDKYTQTLHPNSSVAGPYSDEEIKKGALLMYSSPRTYDLIRNFKDGRYPSPDHIRKKIRFFQVNI